MHAPLGVFVRRPEPLDRSSAGLPDHMGWVVETDGVLLTNAANHVAWEARAVQLVVCSHCTAPGCAKDNYVAIRAVGDGRLLLLPDFEGMASEDRAYPMRAPPDFLEREAWLLELARLTAALPELVAVAPTLRPPSALELARLVQWEAPDRALGDPAAPPALGRDVVEVAADGAPAARVVELLRALLREGDRPARLREAGPGDVPITCFVDGGASGSHWEEWSPMATTPAGLRLRLEPGWIVEPT